MENLAPAACTSRDALINRITHQIRQSLELDQILRATVEEVRAFLGTDRVKVYRFDPEGHGTVVAEARQAERLPSLLGLSFPAGDIPEQARQLFRLAQVRVIVDVEGQTRSLSQPEPLGRFAQAQPLPLGEVPQRPVDPCHAHYLKCMGVASSLVVPLLHHQQLWGLLVSHHAEPRSYSAEELQVVQLVADQVSIAIAQAELLEQARRKAQQERLINQIAALVYSPLHPETTLSTVLEQLTAQLQGIGARLRIQFMGLETLHCYGSQPPAGYDAWLQEQVGRGKSAGDGVRTWSLSQLEKWPELRSQVQQTPIRGLLAVPLLWNEQVVGWLSVFRGAICQETHWAGYRWPAQGEGWEDPRQQLPLISFAAWRELKIDEPKAWSAPELELVSRAAVHLALSITQNQLYRQLQDLNARLEQEVQERTAALQRSLAMDALLQRVTDQVRTTLDEAQILRAVVQELALGLPIQGCDLCLYDPEAGQATVRYEYTAALPPAGGIALTLADYPDLYRQLQRGQAAQLCHLSGQSWIPRREGLTLLVCPLREDQAVLGDLWLAKPADECFSELEVRVVQQVADHCAIAIRQARLYQASVQQISELERLNRLKDDFLSTVSHELRTPITNMKMAIQLLKMARTPQKREQYLQILEQECEREAELVNDLLDLQRLEQGSKPLHLEEVSLAAWLPTVLQPFVQRAQANQQQLRWQIDPAVGKVVTDQVGLERVVQELVNNACKYTPPHHRITVTARRLSPEQVQIRVINEGVEIPRSEWERIFEKFYRIPSGDPWKRGGTGLGLALVKQWMQRLGGSVSIESGQGKTCFTLVLPQGSLQQPPLSRNCA
ncbi:GAF domain-containing protein [Synechococcus sp. H55.2]